MARPRQQKLIDGRNMTCPRCKRSQDILDYTPLMQIESFVDETCPVYKCPACLWLFAPADKVILVHNTVVSG